MFGWMDGTFSGTATTATTQSRCGLTLHAKVSRLQVAGEISLARLNDLGQRGDTDLTPFPTCAQRLQVTSDVRTAANVSFSGYAHSTAHAPVLTGSNDDDLVVGACAHERLELAVLLDGGLTWENFTHC